ncbi:MAG: ATP-dependent DNA helicase RecG [Lachnospiraceae bacterium]|nr:ATP-dependent DNA helicase RecG [Lachnospiraceae bacterium]
MNLTDSIDILNGIGDKRKKLLKKVGIETIRDLLDYYPRFYEDRSVIHKINELPFDEKVTFRGYIKNIENTRIGAKVITKASVSDETGKIGVIWYNQPYLKNSISETDEYMFTGILSKKYGRKEVLSPEFEKVTDKESLSMGRIIPVYHLTEGLGQKFIRGIIKQALDGVESRGKEFINSDIRKAYGLCERNFAVDNIHFPESYDGFFMARRRLVFEEFFLLETALFALKDKNKNSKKGIKFNKAKAVDEFIESLPYSLTGAQLKVIEEIRKDISGRKIMNRLIQGDVGSGKTAVAMAAAFMAVKSGYQCALMAPTDVLSRQHYAGFKSMFEKFGINTVLLTGSLTAKERREAYASIKDGSADIVIGTSAVIQAGVEFKALALVITDEQHRFGVNQRGVLFDKGDDPHVLVMTATPIPRTLALVLYGDLDVSVIDELPPGRQKIDTRAVDSRYRERIYHFIKKHVKDGRQAYIICPMVEESEETDSKAALSYTQELKEGPLKELKVSCLHGRMKPKEKQSIMEEFARGETDVLVSTTVVEVGVDVPNANIIVIENAERFGLAQLHQLRGRVGRGKHLSYCVLITDSKTDIAKKRMDIMVKSTDGFVISEKDLELRGPGEFFGTRQAGVPELKIANIIGDSDVLKQAQEAALKISGELDKEDNIMLKKEIERFFRRDIINI